MLYQWDMSGNQPQFVLDHFDDYLGAKEPVQRFSRKLLLGVVGKVDEIDQRVTVQAENWKMSRMPAVDRNLIRMAVYEMLFEDSSPDLVVIDEAIEIAKRFGSEKSSGFVNGLLDGIHKQQEKDRAGAART